MDRLLLIVDKYKDIISYAVFGVLTTCVNVSAFWILAHIFLIPTIPSTIVAWILAVLFAYITNRKWVFHSAASQSLEVIKEIVSFFSCRLATGVVDWFCMLLFVEYLHWNDMLIKAGANVLVIVLNYIASKLVIFKNRN